MKRTPQAGVTLVEVLVSLVIVAIIGVAGYGMLDQVARTQRLTEGRLQRLGQMQRAMLLLDQDFRQATARSLVQDAGGLGFERAAGDAVVGLHYGLTGSDFMRHMADAKGKAVAEIGRAHV